MYSAAFETVSIKFLSPTYLMISYFYPPINILLKMLSVFISEHSIGIQFLSYFMALSEKFEPFPLPRFYICLQHFLHIIVFCESSFSLLDKSSFTWRGQMNSKYESVMTAPQTFKAVFLKITFTEIVILFWNKLKRHTCHPAFPVLQFSPTELWTGRKIVLLF